MYSLIFFLFLQMAARPYCFLIFLFFIHQASQAQVDITRQKQLFEQELVERGRPPVFAPVPRPISYTNVETSFIPPTQPIHRSETARTLSANCTDSSFSKKFETISLSHSFQFSTKTADGGILMGGFGRNQWATPTPPSSSILTKFDSIGNHIWSRQINSDVHFSFYIESIYELSDGSIIVTGWHGNLLYGPPGNYADLFVCKLSSTGDLTWFKTFHSTEITCSSGNIRSIAVAEGINGDLFFAGTLWNCPFPKNLVTFKLDNAGTLQWSYTYKAPDIDGYAIGIFYVSGSVTVINKNSATGMSDINFLKLDPATGNLISQKNWRVSSGIFNHLFINQVKSIRLNNGNYCVYGVTFGSFNSTPATQAMRYAVLEFDPAYEYLNGFGIVTPGLGNYQVDQIKVNRDKRVLMMMFNNNLPYPSVDQYIGTVFDGQVQSQRKKEIRNTETFSSQMEIFGDGSYVLVNSLATMGQSNFWLDYSLMHDSDTASSCLGLEANFATVQSVEYDLQPFNWQSIPPNVLTPTNNQNNSSLPIVFNGAPPCIQKAKCDTLKIHGISAFCDYQQDLTFTAYRRMECGSTVNWSINPAVLVSSQVLNDTTVKIRLNQAWQGWLYAIIPTSCGILKDSIWLTVGSSPGPVNLGPDITICGGNPITITAPAGYLSYVWSTGATEPAITVNSAGIYSIVVTDACGNTYNDAIEVFAAPPIAVSIGPDRIKCNNDTIHINAPAGFLNYSWGPNYFINTTAGSSVIVQPPMDTIYYVRVEQSLGCYGYDTIRVLVRNSTPILLGADKSICFGDTLMLDAGPGFGSYTWSNGGSNQTIKAFASGQYHVAAVNSNNCISRDTIVLNVRPKPVIQLDKSPGICEGSSRLLNAGNFSSYLWQDGSSLSTFSVTTTGTYHVTVTDEHSCKASDTTIIARLYPLPGDFIFGETQICNFGTSSLSASSNYTSYLWNTNSISSSILISQPGQYWLHVVDQNGCAGTDTTLITVKECLKGFYIPSAFTPNNDGLNDLFKPTLNGNVVQYSFTIYNRWGEAVFASTQPAKGWDGKHKGATPDTHLYVWTCMYQFAGEPVKFAKGTVVVIK